MERKYKMNFTGKTKLTDKEFIEVYEKLWELTPHYFSNWPSDQEIIKNKSEGEKIYNSEDEQINEEWLPYPEYNKYIISSLGRIKYKINEEKSEFLKQDDNGKKGYLVISGNEDLEKINKIKLNKTQYIYMFVAKTFLGKRDGDGFHVHHINNNGYDCSIENLILLTASQHRIIHLSRKLTIAQLEDSLNPVKNCDEYKIKLHLTNYKLGKGILDCGEYKRNGKKYSHILTDCKDNLITVSYKDEMIKLYEKMHGKLHMYFSHLTSSQALCFNLFEPLIIEKKLDLIDSSISIDAKSEFEHIEKNSFEKCSTDKDKTNFDFFIQDKNDRLFFELKYTEQSFGYVPNYFENDKHDRKFKDYYKDQIEKIAPDIDEKQFFDNYQLWRNICHVTLGKVFFIILKDRNDLTNDVVFAKTKCKDEYKEKIQIIYIEDLVKDILNSSVNDKLKIHYKEFWEKYLNF